MSDVLFPRVNTQFNKTNNWTWFGLSFHLTNGAVFTLNSTQSDASSITWALANSEIDPSSWLSFDLAEHLPDALIYELGETTPLQQTDITAYEVYMEYNARFDGNMVMSVYNCDLTNIEIVQLMQFYIDMSNNGGLLQGLIFHSDSNSSFVVMKSLASNANVYIEINTLDELNNVVDRTIVDINDYVVDQSVLSTIPIGKYLIVFTSKTNHDNTENSTVQMHVITGQEVDQGDVIDFTSRDELHQYYNVFEEDIVRSYDKLFSADTQNTMDYITSTNGLMCSLNLKSTEIVLYRFKNIIFKNLSNVDTTFVIRDAYGDIMHQSITNDYTHALQITDNDTDTVIEIYSGDFTLGGNYDLSCDFTITPNLINESIIGSIVDQILVLPETLESWDSDSLILTGGLSTEIDDGFIGFGLIDSTT